MRWFGFGFNGFGQICLDECNDRNKEVNIVTPTELTDVNKCERPLKACWSRRASLQPDGKSTPSPSSTPLVTQSLMCLFYPCLAQVGDSCCLSLSGFRAGSEFCSLVVQRSRGCRDVSISDSHLVLAFSDRLESWDHRKEEETSPTWRMEIKSEKTDPSLNLPLVPGGYITTKPPFYHPLSPHLQAKSLALSGEHALLLSASGAVYTWGLGSHGQLGHGGLTSEEEPRVVEALWGMPMGRVAAGGWHSVCISDGGDLYVWGWNESGQLGLPSRALRKNVESHQGSVAAGASSTAEAEGKEENEEVFISIQAFPALLDVSTSCEVVTVSCGSRHTAAVTATGDLYTWGWGEYGQLGHKTLISIDEPQRVDFFQEQHLHVVDVVCGPWNTFTAVAKEEVT